MCMLTNFIYFPSFSKSNWKFYFTNYFKLSNKHLHISWEIEMKKVRNLEIKSKSSWIKSNFLYIDIEKKVWREMTFPLAAEGYDLKVHFQYTHSLFLPTLFSLGINNNNNKSHPTPIYFSAKILILSNPNNCKS